MSLKDKSDLLGMHSYFRWLNLTISLMYIFIYVGSVKLTTFKKVEETVIKGHDLGLEKKEPIQGNHEEDKI